MALRSQLAFTLSPPADLLCSALRDPSFARCDYLTGACRRIQEGAEVERAWAAAVTESREPFTAEDRSQMTRLGEILGKSDLETQLSQLALLAERLEQQAGEARGQAQTQARLSTTLGALTGLALAILLY